MYSYFYEHFSCKTGLIARKGFIVSSSTTIKCSSTTIPPHCHSRAKARTIGWLVPKYFFRNQQGRITQKSKKNNQKIAKKNSKFFGAFSQTLGLWQIHSFEVGPKKVLFSDAS
jgi:hypothetical protein